MSYEINRKKQYVSILMIPLMIQVIQDQVEGQVEVQIMEVEEVVLIQVGTSQKDRKVWEMMKMTMTLYQ